MNDSNNSNNNGDNNEEEEFKPISPYDDMLNRRLGNIPAPLRKKRMDDHKKFLTPTGDPLSYIKQQRMSKSTTSLDETGIKQKQEREERYEQLQSLKQQLKEEEETWTSKLQDWKSRRRSATSDLRERKENREQIEKMTSSRAQLRRHKTYAEMLEDKKRREGSFEDITSATSSTTSSFDQPIPPLRNSSNKYLTTSRSDDVFRKKQPYRGAKSQPMIKNDVTNSNMTSSSSSSSSSESDQEDVTSPQINNNKQRNPLLRQSPVTYTSHAKLTSSSTLPRDFNRVSDRYSPPKPSNSPIMSNHSGVSARSIINNVERNVATSQATRQASVATSRVSPVIRNQQYSPPKRQSPVRQTSSPTRQQPARQPSTTSKEQPTATNNTNSSNSPAYRVVMRKKNNNQSAAGNSNVGNRTQRPKSAYSVLEATTTSPPNRSSRLPDNYHEYSSPKPYGTSRFVQYRKSMFNNKRNMWENRSVDTTASSSAQAPRPTLSALLQEDTNKLQQNIPSAETTNTHAKLVKSQTLPSSARHQYPPKSTTIEPVTDITSSVTKQRLPPKRQVEKTTPPVTRPTLPPAAPPIVPFAVRSTPPAAPPTPPVVQPPPAPVYTNIEPDKKFVPKYEASNPVAHVAVVPPTINADVAEDMKICIIQKPRSAKGFGFTVRGGDNGKPVIVDSVNPGGAADICQLCVNDEIIAINDVILTSLSSQDGIVQLIVDSIITGNLALNIRRKKNTFNNNNNNNNKVNSLRLSGTKVVMTSGGFVTLRSDKNQPIMTKNTQQNNRPISNNHYSNQPIARQQSSSSSSSSEDEKPPTPPPLPTNIDDEDFPPPPQDLLSPSPDHDGVGVNSRFQYGDIDPQYANEPPQYANEENYGGPYYGDNGPLYDDREPPQYAPTVPRKSSVTQSKFFNQVGRSVDDLTLNNNMDPLNNNDVIDDEKATWRDNNYYPSDDDDVTSDDDELGKEMKEIKKSLTTDLIPPTNSSSISPSSGNRNNGDYQLQQQRSNEFQQKLLEDQRRLEEEELRREETRRALAEKARIQEEQVQIQLRKIEMEKEEISRRHEIEKNRLIDSKFPYTTSTGLRTKSTTSSSTTGMTSQQGEVFRHWLIDEAMKRNTRGPNRGNPEEILHKFNNSRSLAPSGGSSKVDRHPPNATLL